MTRNSPQSALTDGVVAFRELIAPFVEYSRERLLTSGVAREANLTEAAIAEDCNALLSELSNAIGQALFAEFAKFRMRTASKLQAVADPGSSIYEAFIHEMLGGSLISFFEQYPAAARLLGTLMVNWWEARVELLERFVQDSDAVGCVFAHGQPRAAKIALFHSMPSDPHRGGRRAILITLCSGDRLVYKPRDVSVDAVFSKLLDWVNSNGWTAQFRAPSFVVSDGYGWMEYVESADCESVEEVEDFYFRAGGLLALLRLTGTFDCHCENVIAARGHPILVDLETMFSAPMRGFGPAADPRSYSVLDTHFLPALESGAGRKWDVSGLGGAAGFETALTRVRIEFMNTNRMSAVHQSLVTNVESNRPTLHNMRKSVNEFEECLIAGFEAMERLLVQERPALQRPCSRLAAFRGCVVRYVFRPTSGYLRLIERGHGAELLRSVSARDAAMNAIVEPLVGTDGCLGTEVRELVRAERAALLDDDVPRFAASAAATWIEHAPGERKDELLAYSGFDGALARLGAMSRRTTCREVALIRAALRVRYHEQGTRLRKRSARELSIHGCLEAAEALARALHESGVVPRGEGSPWITLDRDQQSGARTLRRMGLSLYDGVGGVGFFFAALAKATGEKRWRDTALSAADHLRSGVEAPNSPITSRAGIGGLDGNASVLYALLYLALWLNDESLLQLCDRLVALIDQQLSVGEHEHDVLSGAAGATMVLVAYYEATGHSDAVTVATHCAESMLRGRIACDGGWGWPTLGGRPLTGFSHGAAGISAALIRLSAHSSDPRWSEAATQALSFERAHFNPALHAWHDLRQPLHHQGKPMNGWCHGATGIGLARTTAQRTDHDRQTDNEIAVAIDQAEDPNRTDDSLCCGLSGRADFLLAVSSVDHRRAESTRSAACRILAEICGSRNPIEQIQLNDAGDCSQYDARLFRGLSGIGYVLLRATSPTEFPSVAALESPAC